MDDDLTESGKNLVRLAKGVRASAEAYHRTVQRYCAEMPGHLDAFHAAMLAFRQTAEVLARSPQNAGHGLRDGRRIAAE